MRRAATAVLACLAAAVVGCRGTQSEYSYTYTKDQISQEQLLRDERALEGTKGVTRVTSTHHQDQSAAIEVVVDASERMAVQQRLSAMGYVRGQH